MAALQSKKNSFKQQLVAQNKLLRQKHFLVNEMEMPSNPTYEQNNGPLAPITNFIKQSERVLNVTHKPGPFEFRQIAYITAIGMAVIGGLGFALSMGFHLLRGTL